MPCNPAIGGTARAPGARARRARRRDGARGGTRPASSTGCSTAQGPAVHSLRAQADRRRYQAVMKLALESRENLRLIQAEAVGDRPRRRRRGLGHRPRRARSGAAARAVICTGTYLRGRTITGEVLRGLGPRRPRRRRAALGVPEGPRRARSAASRRARRRASTPGAWTSPRWRSRRATRSRSPSPSPRRTPPENRARCYLTYTNERTHEIIRANLGRSPLYSGVITGTGPRYCPSIETKVMTFPDKPRHQLS